MSTANAHPKFSATIELPVEAIASLLISALEGGSREWCSINKLVKPKKLFRHDPEMEIDHVDFPLSEGGAVVINDLEDGGKHRLDLAAITRGVQCMAEQEARHFADAIAENADATTGDVFLQCCIFGRVIYG